MKSKAGLPLTGRCTGWPQVTVPQRVSLGHAGRLVCSPPPRSCGSGEQSARRPFQPGTGFQSATWVPSKQHRPDACLSKVWNDPSRSAGLDWHCLLICCGLLRITRLLANSRRSAKQRQSSVRKTAEQAGKTAAAPEPAAHNGFGGPLRGKNKPESGGNDPEHWRIMELGSKGEGVAYAKEKRRTKPFKQAKLSPAELPGGSSARLRQHFGSPSGFFDETGN